MTLQVGDLAPDFTMPAASGGSVSLRDLRGKKVVLYFYPKDDTPGCTIEACAFRDNLPNFEGVNAEIIGVSRDNTESHQRFRDKYNLNFTLASDDTGEVTEAYEVWKEKNMYGKTFMGIQRATFLIDEDGRIAHVWPSVSVTGHVEEVLAAVNGRLPQAAAAEPAAQTAAAPATKPAPRKAAKAAAKPARKPARAKAARKPAAKRAKAPARKAKARKAPARKTKAAAKTARKPARTAKKATRKTAKPARKTAKKSAKKPGKRAAARTSMTRRRTAGRRPARRTAAARRRR